MKKFQIIVGLFVVMISLITASGALADRPIAGKVGRAEIRFLTGMIDHHQMALDMATDCLSKAQTEAVKKICHNILKTQSPEIKVMRGWLLSWYQIDYVPRSVQHGSMPMMNMMDMGSMMGQGNNADMSMMHIMMQCMAMMDHSDEMTTGLMAGLSGLEGHEYELAWLETMTEHHQDAVTMAQRILKVAEHKPLRDLAEKIISDQSAEIETMETLLTTLDTK